MIKFDQIKPVLSTFLYALITYIVYQIIFYLFGFNKIAIQFQYSITFLFGLFTFLSMLIIALLLLVKTKYFDSIGYAFMALTSLKIGLLLFWARPILKSTLAIAKFEKGNFFILFAVFLAIETIVAIRILNNKQ